MIAAVLLLLGIVVVILVLAWQLRRLLEELYVDS